MTVSQVVAYRFLKQDGSLAKVGLRFGVSPRDIWEASQELPTIKGRPASSLKPGESLLIPIPPPDRDPNERYEWRAGIIATKTTVAAFADNVNQGEASRAIPITGEFLWFNIKNADLRDARIRAGEPDSANANLQVNDTIQVPYRKSVPAAISAAPTPSGPLVGPPDPRNPSTNVTVVSGRALWTQVIEDATTDLLSLTAVYANLAQPGMRLRVECAKDAVIVHVLGQFVDLLAAQGQGQVPSIIQLQKMTSHAEDVVGRHMLINPAKVVLHWDENDKQNAAKAVLDKMTDPNVLAALKECRKTPDLSVLYPWNDACKQASELLLDSSRSAEVGQLIDDALKFAPSIKNDQLTDPKTTFDVMVAMAGATSTVIGNTPSPSNLIIGLASMRTVQNLPTLLNDPVLCGAISTRLLNIVLKLRVPDPNAPSGVGRVLTDDETNAIRTAVLNGDVDVLQQWGPKLVTKYAEFGQRSFGTTVTVSFLSLISLLATISSAQSETIRLRLWANVGASTTTLSLAGMQASFAALEALDVGKPLRGWLLKASTSEAAEAVGVFGCVCGIISGTLSILEATETGDDNEFWLGVASAAGGTMSLAGWLCMVPGLQVAGALVGLAGAAVGAYQIVKDKMREGTERVFSTRLAQFRASYNVKPFEHDVGEFASAIGNLADFALNSAKFFTLDDTPENRANIAKLNFGDDEVKLIFGT